MKTLAILLLFCVQAHSQSVTHFILSGTPTVAPPAGISLNKVDSAVGNSANWNKTVVAAAGTGKWCFVGINTYAGVPDSVVNTTTGVKLRLLKSTATSPGVTLWSDSTVVEGNNVYNTKDASTQYYSAGFIVLNGVSSTDTASSATGNSGTAAATIAAATGQWIVSVVGVEVGTITGVAVSPTVMRWTVGNNADGEDAWGGSTAGEAVSSVSYTLSASQVWRMCAARAKP